MSLLEIPWRPPTSTLRWFAAICFVLLVAFGGVMWQRGENATLGFTLIAIGIALGVLGLTYPNAIRPIFVGSMVVTYPIGWVVSHVLLAFIYYCLFTPLGLFFRLIGRDALGQRLESQRESYWTPKPAAGDITRYFYQS